MTIPPQTPSLSARVAGEMMGTFALVFVGCGAMMVDVMAEGALGHLGVCTAFGGIIAVMIFATGHLSGAHFNPAVTLGFASIGRFSWKDVPAYIVGQFLAAIAASFLLRWLLGDIGQMGMTLPVEELSVSRIIVIEVILTAFLMFLITAVATDSRASGALAAVAIGITVGVCSLVGGPLTGCSMNPARSLGPALAHSEWAFQWIYLIFPLLGGQCGAWAYEWIRGDRQSA